MSLRIVALLLLALGCSDASDRSETLDFGPIERGYPQATELETFEARDGASLALRHYPAAAPVALVLFHGSGGHSLYLSELAASIANAGVAEVYTPDLRGHGADPERRGDIDYIDQLEHDAADLIAEIRRRSPGAAVVVGGHSSGGGLAIRLAGADVAEAPDGYLLLAPFLQHDAPTVRPNSGGWAKPKTGRIVVLSILNGFGVTALNGLTALEFDRPPGSRTGLETDAYSYRLMTGFAPRDYRTDLQRLRAPTLVLVGDRDEAFVADAFAGVFGEWAPHARVDLVPSAGHIGLVFEPAVREAVVAWLAEVNLSAGSARGAVQLSSW